MFASYCYQDELNTPEILAIVREDLLAWRAAIATKLRAAAATQPPRIEVDLDDLADLATTIVEGAYIMARTFHDGSMMGRNLRQYRNYLELLFAPWEPPS